MLSAFPYDVPLAAGVLFDVVLADPGMCCTILVQTRELVLLCVRYIAFGEDVFLVFFRGEGAWVEALRAIPCILGYFSSFGDVHTRPLWAVGWEVAKMVFVEIFLGCP